MKHINILCIGDIVGSPGRATVQAVLAAIKHDHHIHFTVANVENSAGGFGLTSKISKELSLLGIDAFTSGNHIYDQKSSIADFPQLKKLVRPLNFPPNNPGQGVRIFSFNSVKIAIVNLIGRVFMNGAYDCPFRALDHVLSDILNETPIVLVDFHAETTSEKQALCWHAAGRISALWGTHTHVQTADSRILDHHTGYITDLGMVGAINGIIGMEREPIIHRFITQMPARFQTPKTSSCQFNGIVLSIDVKTGKTEHISRIYKEVDLD